MKTKSMKINLKNVIEVDGSKKKKQQTKKQEEMEQKEISEETVNLKDIFCIK